MKSYIILLLTISTTLSFLIPPQMAPHPASLKGDITSFSACDSLPNPIYTITELKNLDPIVEKATVRFKIQGTCSAAVNMKEAKISAKLGIIKIPDITVPIGSASIQGPIDEEMPIDLSAYPVVSGSYTAWIRIYGDDETELFCLQTQFKIDK